MIRIGDRAIGPGSPCFVIAEVGVNHNGELDLAKRLIEAAAVAEADAVKFQTFRADQVALADAPKAEYQIERTGEAGSLRDMLRGLELDKRDHEELARYAEAQGIIFCSTPFDLESADLLGHLGVPFFKVSSGDLTYTPLLRHLAGKRKPLLLSTGMSNLDEVGLALETLAERSEVEVVLLHCVTDYPASPAEANLRAMTAMRDRFGAPVGYSDHTLGTAVAMAAVALGAVVLEKHLTLDRTLPGPDHYASLEPAMFQEMVAQVRIVESALGDGVKRPASSELSNRIAARRSLVAAVDILAGTVIRPTMLECKRPGDGISASEYDSIVGRETCRRFRAGEQITRDGVR